MPVQLNLNNAQADEEKSIKIIQINLYKSEKAHLEIIDNNVSQKCDIMLIQEPHSTTFNTIRIPANFRPIFPSNRLQDDAQIRSVIWVNRRLDTKDWTRVDILDTNDLTAIQLKGPYGKLTIFNIYNDCTHSRNEATLRRFIHSHTNTIIRSVNHHMIWAGDFNRHHPLWDHDKDIHLFTWQATRRAEGLIELLAKYEMQMVLPKGLLTLQHMRLKRYSWPDNLFTSPGIQDQITKCEVDPASRPTSTDHFSIVTHVLLPQERIITSPSYSFRDTDWDNYRKNLRLKLRRLCNEPLTKNNWMKQPKSSPRHYKKPQKK